MKKNFFGRKFFFRKKSIFLSRKCEIRTQRYPLSSKMVFLSEVDLNFMFHQNHHKYFYIATHLIDISRLESLI